MGAIDGPSEGPRDNAKDGPREGPSEVPYAWALREHRPNRTHSGQPANCDKKFSASGAKVF